MELDALIQAIGLQASRQREEILARAEREAQEVLRQAHSRRDATVGRARERAAASARAEAVRLESLARLQARRELLAARHELLEAALRELEGQVRALLGTAAYREVLERLLDECRDEAAGPATVRCRREDRPAVEAWARRRGIACSVEDADFPLGGVEVAWGPEGRTRCRNTLADLLGQLRPQLRQEAARALFGPAEGGSAA